MPIYSNKIDGIRPMLIQYFGNADPISKNTLLRKVEEDIITISVKEGFIQSSKSADGIEQYRITSKGRQYRDEGTY